MRYIDEAPVNARLKEICDDYAMLYGKEYGGMAEKLASLTDDIPTADVVEVRHGEWIDDGDCFHCSDCGKTYQLGSLQTIYDVKRCWTYCPHCGAVMDRKTKNELLENFEQLVKTNDVLTRDGKTYEVVIADDNIFVICLMGWDNLQGSWVTHYDVPEIYANQSSINTLEELRFEKADRRVAE